MEASAGRDDAAVGVPNRRWVSPLFAEPEVSDRMALVLRIVNILSLGVVGVGGYFASFGLPIGLVSEVFPTPFTPADYAFAIWGPIFFGVFLQFLVYSFLPVVNRGLVFRRVGYWNAALCMIFLAAWLVAFTQVQLWLATAFIGGMLICLVAIYIRIHVERGNFSSTKYVRRTRTWLEWICVYVPWALYTSWVLAATLLNIFEDTRLQPGAVIHEAIIALAFAAFLNLMVLAYTRDVVFAGVNVWTLIAISLRPGVSPMVGSVAIALAYVVGTCSIVVWGLNSLDLIRSMQQPSLPVSTSNGAPSKIISNDKERSV